MEGDLVRVVGVEQTEVSPERVTIGCTDNQTTNPHTLSLYVEEGLECRTTEIDHRVDDHEVTGQIKRME